MMASEAFERFRFSFFADPTSARDGLDIAALQALDGDERAQAETLLLDYLPDTRGVIGLGALRSARAGPALQRLFDAAEFTSDLAQIELARALWRIRPAPRWRDALIAMLSTSGDAMLRSAAARALNDVRDPLAVDALLAALDGGEPLVRHHAARGLLALHGLPDAASDPQHMIYRVMSIAAEHRDAGRCDIIAAIAGRPLA